MSVAQPARPASAAQKELLIARLLTAKEASGKTFSELASELELTNVYTAQLFHLQQQLKPETAEKLKKLVPQLSDGDVAEMQKAPWRQFDPAIIQEPTVYRLNEAIMHSGEAIKAIINEQCGDGIMSAIDFYCNVDTVPGVHGEKRVVITFNGKYLPYAEQKLSGDVSRGR